MNDKNFKIFGDEEILKKTKVNIAEVGETEQIKTLLFYGRKAEVKSEDENAVIYKVYISYNDSLVNFFKFENIMRNSDDYINHLYITKKKDVINVAYFGRESKTKKEDGFNIILLPKEEFFKKNNINKDQKKFDKLFFDSY